MPYCFDRQVSLTELPGSEWCRGSTCKVTSKFCFYLIYVFTFRSLSQFFSKLGSAKCQNATVYFCFYFFLGENLQLSFSIFLLLLSYNKKRKTFEFMSDLLQRRNILSNSELYKQCQLKEDHLFLRDFKHTFFSSLNCLRMRQSCVSVQNH